MTSRKKTTAQLDPTGAARPWSLASWPRSAAAYERRALQIKNLASTAGRQKEIRARDGNAYN
eukprot:3903896-Lingulodinium_polyedra.AAC.1